MTRIHTEIQSSKVTKGYYKLFMFISVDMEILTPRSGQVHPEAQLKGAKISISTDRNVNNEFIPGYGKK